MINKYIKLKKKTVVAIIFSFLCLCLWNYTYAENTTEHKEVLVINSYHQGFRWSQEQTDGIIDILKKSGINLSIFVEYMDWKNYPTPENIDHLYNIFEYKYKSKHIDILIATDDAALEFALNNRGHLFSNAPVVFSGVNQEGVTKITTGHNNFTGVLEEVDPTNTIKMALEINPDLENIYVLFDNSESGVSSGKLVIEKIRTTNANLNTIPLNTLSYDDLIKSVRSCKDNSIILVTTYFGDIDGKIVQFESVSRDISVNSNVPVYHLYDLGLNNGAFGGMMMSGKLQGMSAANLAIRILNGESPDDIPILSPGTTRKVFDYQQLKRFSIPINKVPKDSEVVNKPFSFFETYKTFVLSITAAFIVLIAFVCILLFYIKQINKMKKNISDSHEELTQIYEELTASEEELKQQYEKVLNNHQKLRESEEKLTYLAYYDTMTGLPNKLSLYEDTSKYIFSSQNGKAALLFIDIDNLKYINDVQGHAFGDQLIIKASERLTSLLKEGCSVYRLGGDEFVVTIQGIKGELDAKVFASYILAGFKEEFDIQNSVRHVSLSIGIAIYPEHGINLEELLKHADIAMYKAKDGGKNKFVTYNLMMNEALTERVNIEKHLRTALGKNEFEIHYQPQLDLKTNKISGFEALLRWNNAELGAVSPLKFIPVAEDTHLIIPLGDWVIRNACAFLKKLHNKGHRHLFISINISVLQLLHNDFYDLVLDTLEFFDLEPHCLELEITESVLMKSYDSIRSNLETLREMGVKIALDDFGKGYSSLSYLKKLPLSTLKIDKSFIDDITCESSNKDLTGQIILVGKSMGLCVVAEGVESQEELEYLIEYGCDKIQGYLCSEPLPESEIEKLLERD